MLIPGREKRLFGRVDCAGSATILVRQDGPRSPAKILDLSFGGCLLQLEKAQELEVETMVELTFTVNSEPFRVKGEVRSLRPESKIGFQFHSLSMRTRRRIKELIADLGGEGCIKDTYEVKS